MSEFLLAFDIGMTGNKAALLDAKTEAVTASATASYPTFYTPDGAEQSAVSSINWFTRLRVLRTKTP